MPVILDAADEALWLDRTATTFDVMYLLRPFDPTGMEAYPVSARVGSVRNDDPALLEPAVP
jgi:putative SOS response-associated peptidase YedK